MNIHMIKARDLPDLWFQAVHDILDNGRRFTIDRGSYAGQTRLEYDYFCGHVLYPYTMPLIPDIPPALGIPNPVEEAYIYGGDGYERSYIEYLMTGHKEPGESYTYGERLTRAPITGNKREWWETDNKEIIDRRDVDGKVVFEEDGILYWVAPMDPNYRRDGPGKSPMGMDLVPVYAADAAAADDAPGTVRISPAVGNNLGVRSAPAQRRLLQAAIRTVGYVRFYAMTPEAENMGEAAMACAWSFLEYFGGKTEGELESLW